MTLLIIGYVLSVLVATYLMARYIDPMLAALGTVWPFFIPFVPLLLAAYLGDKHANRPPRLSPSARALRAYAEAVK